MDQTNTRWIIASLPRVRACVCVYVRLPDRGGGAGSWNDPTQGSPGGEGEGNVQEGAVSSRWGVPQNRTVTGRKVSPFFFFLQSGQILQLLSTVTVSSCIWKMFFVRLELENRLSSMQQQTSLKDAAARDQLAEWEERLSGAKHREESLCLEIQDLR